MADPNRMVKEYQRPAAGKSDPRPSELRPPEVLLKTVNYLIDEIVPKTDCPWSRVYEFIFDRLRSVRQDMVIQRIEGAPAMELLQKVIRFYFYANYRMCTEPASKFDARINETHLQECLKRLLVLYSAEEDCEQSSEFYELFLLYNIGHCDALLLGLQAKEKFKASKSFNQALSISLAWWRGNYARVLRLSRSLPALHCCAIHHHFSSINFVALQRMSCGFNSKSLSFPVQDLRALLNLNSDQQTIELCQQFGFSVSLKGNITFLRTSFKADHKIAPSHFDFVDEKLSAKSVEAWIHGT